MVFAKKRKKAAVTCLEEATAATASTFTDLYTYIALTLKTSFILQGGVICHGHIPV
jgi:hypothetical protein